MLTSIKYSVLLCSTSCRSMVGNYAYVLVTCAGPSRQGYFGFKVDASLKSKSLQVISALVAVAVLSQVPAKLLKHREHQAQEPSSTSSTYLTVGRWILWVLVLHEICRGVQSVKCQASFRTQHFRFNWIVQLHTRSTPRALQSIFHPRMQGCFLV